MEKKEYQYLFPFEKIGGMTNIILYGAGKVGKDYYGQLSERDDINVMMWADKKYADLVREELPIENPDKIAGASCDAVILAAKRLGMAECMKQDLLEKGVAEERIVWLEPQDRMVETEKIRREICVPEGAEASSAAILYIGIGDYICFWRGFYATAERFFLPETRKEYYVFTDQKNFFAEDNARVHIIEQKNQGWPLNSLLRFRFFNAVSQQLLKHDYIFFMNANVMFVQTVEEKEFLPEKEDYVFVWHHNFCGKDPDTFPYDRNPESMAYIPYGSGKYYITGGVNGGRAEAFMQMSEELDGLIQRDLKNNVMALWHDESFINKYALSAKNFKVLSPSYFYPELVGCISLRAQRKIVARDKRKYFDICRLKNDSSLFIQDPKKQIMDAYYHRLYHKWLLLRAGGISCTEFLTSYERVAICSFRGMGEILIKEMETAGMANKLDCILAPDPEAYNGPYPVIKPYEVDCSIDLIVVTDAYDYGNIVTDLSLLSDVPILSIEEIVDKLLYGHGIVVQSKIW